MIVNRAYLGVKFALQVINKCTYIFVLPEVNVALSQLFPCYKLAGCTVDGLSRQLEGPFVLPFGTEELALNMEEGVRLRGLLYSGGHDLNRLHFLICERDWLFHGMQDARKMDVLIPR